MRYIVAVALLSACPSALLAAPAAADTGTGTDTLAADQPERDYLPEAIVVTGQRSGYGSEDGASATKTPTPIIDVPQAMTVITQDQLEDQSIRQLGDALRFVPGVSLETGEGQRDEIFIRGQETTADFYLDGLRDDAQYYRSLYDIERVEILKGSNALIFGRGAGGGAVNRVAKTAQIGRPVTAFDASVDSFGAFAILGDVGTDLGDNAAVRLNAAYEEFDNQRDFYQGRFIGIAPTATLRLGPDTRLTAHYSYNDDRRLTDRGNPADGAGPLRGYDRTLFGDRDFNRFSAVTQIARARLEHSFTSDFSLNATVQFADYDKAYANILPVRLLNAGTEVELSGYRDTQDRQNWVGQANLVWQGSTGPIGHTLLAGVELIDQATVNTRQNAFFQTATGAVARVRVPLARELSLPAINLGPDVRNRDSQLTTLSAYLQDQIAIGEHFEIVAGLRWDRFDLRTVERLTGVRGDRVDETVSPRVGVIFKPQETLSLYASYATSFLPQAGDQFLLLTPGNAAFEPEKFRSYELGAKWLPRPGLLATAALFRLERSDTRGPSPADPTLVGLFGKSRVEGFELALAGEIARNWNVNLGYTYLDGEVTQASEFGPAGARLEQLPRHQVTAWSRLDLTPTLGLGLGAIYQDEQFASFSNRVTLPDYVRVDAAVYYTFSDRVSLQLNIENLLDADYYPSAHGDNNIQPGEPLNARLGLRIAL